MLIRHVTMTMTFDPLTLKVCVRSGVTWSQSVVNLSEIEQFPTELFMIWQIFAPLRLAVTLTFDSLTLNFCSASGVMCTNSLQNLIEIEQSAAELLTINDRFFVCFRDARILRELFLKRVDRSAPNLVGTLPDHRYTPSLTRSSATAQKTAVGHCVYADAIHTASFARSRVYSHSM